MSDTKIFNKDCAYEVADTITKECLKFKFTPWVTKSVMLEKDDYCYWVKPDIGWNSTQINGNAKLKRASSSSGYDDEFFIAIEDIPELVKQLQYLYDKVAPLLVKGANYLNDKKSNQPFTLN